ncbi:MAG: HAD family hydrolase [Anaerolineae bacterium]|nr:HAD family hydrolase [Anaerolineae bacterium]
MVAAPPFRMVATDIDGTLVDDNGSLSPVSIQVLRQLLDRGIVVMLVTGLNPWPARRYTEQIGRGIRALCLNGIFLLEDGEIRSGAFIDPDVAREAAKFLQAQGYIPLVYGADNVSRYMPEGAPEAMSKVAELVAARPYQPYQPVADFDTLFTVQPAQVSISDTDQRAATIYPALKNAVGDRAYVVYQPTASTDRSWVEVNHPQARKDAALISLAAKMGIPPAEILYFGDSLNDIPVFKALAHPVAVANARPEVLDLAWQTTLTNNAHGVAHFLTTTFDLERKNTQYA